MFLKTEHVYPLKPLPRAGSSHSWQALSPSNPYLERVSGKTKGDG